MVRIHAVSPDRSHKCESSSQGMFSGEITNKLHHHATLAPPHGYKDVTTRNFRRRTGSRLPAVESTSRIDIPGFTILDGWLVSTPHPNGTLGSALFVKRSISISMLSSVRTQSDPTPSQAETDE